MDIDVPLANGEYDLQFLFYEGFGNANRLESLVVEGSSVISGYQPYPEQGSTSLTGSLVAHTVNLTDGNLDIVFGGAGDNPVISGLTIASANAVPEPSSIVIVPILLGLIATQRHCRRSREAAGT